MNSMKLQNSMFAYFIDRKIFSFIQKDLFRPLYIISKYYTLDAVYIFM